MKSKVLAIAATICMLCCGTATAQWPHNTYGNKNQWEVEVGTRILDRPTTDVLFSLVSVVPTNVPVFNTQDAADLDTSAGADFRFLKRTCYDGAWEVRGTVDSWDNFESRSGVLSSPLFTPVALPGGSRLIQFDYEYSSTVFSLELNCKRAVRPGLTFLIGPRYVDMSEQIDINSTFDNPGIPGFLLNLDTVTEADNHMPGLGFGLELRRPLTRQIFFVGAVKGAILANFASTSTVTTSTLIGGLPVATTVFDDSGTHAAGIGEINARLHYDIAPGTVSAYCGYEAIWMDGVAVAPAQLLETVAPPISLNTSTTTFAHGLACGLMFRY